jgi:ABC-type dipeptide/oligopeptide/nickel transport system ATPase component
MILLLDEPFRALEHPYTQALLAAIPGRQRKAPPILPDAPRDDVRH